MAKQLKTYFDSWFLLHCVIWYWDQLCLLTSSGFVAGTTWVVSGQEKWTWNCPWKDKWGSSSVYIH